MRKHKLNNTKLVKILEERGRVLEEGKQLQKDVESLQKKQQKVGYKMNRLKDKTEPLMKAEQENITLKEFDYIARVFVEKGVSYIEVKNQVDDYIDLLREKANESNNSDNKQQGQS